MTENRLPEYLGYMFEAIKLTSGCVDIIDKVEFIVDKHSRQVVVINLVNLSTSQEISTVTVM